MKKKSLLRYEIITQLLINKISVIKKKYLALELIVCLKMIY